MNVRYASRSCALVLALGLASCAEPEQPPAPEPAASGVRLVQVWEISEALNRPESVVYDAARDVLYVSSINGDGSAKDGNGYLSRISPSGEVLEAEWVTGLDAPKGLALSGDTLYATDIDALVVIDASSGQIVARHAAEGATFLNDVTADDAGNVYVSDSGTSRLYRLQGGRLEAWLQNDKRISNPNGVHVGDGLLLVAAGDSSAENPGGARYLQTVAYGDQAIAPLQDRTPLGSIDAVEPDERGGYFLTDWGAGTVMHFTSASGATVLEQLGQGTADLEYVAGTNMIFLPVMMSDQLIAYRVEWPAE